MRVVAPIRLSMRFCGLLSLRNMVRSPSTQRHVADHPGFGGARFVDAQLHAAHPGLGTYPESPVGPLEVLECQTERRRCGTVFLAWTRYRDHSTAAVFRQADHHLQPSLELLAAARP